MKLLIWLRRAYAGIRNWLQAPDVVSLEQEVRRFRPHLYRACHLRDIPGWMDQQDALDLIRDRMIAKGFRPFQLDEELSAVLREADQFFAERQRMFGTY